MHFVNAIRMAPVGNLQLSLSPKYPEAQALRVDRAPTLLALVCKKGAPSSTTRPSARRNTTSPFFFSSSSTHLPTNPKPRYLLAPGHAHWTDEAHTRAISSGKPASQAGQPVFVYAKLRAASYLQSSALPPREKEDFYKDTKQTQELAQRANSNKTPSRGRPSTRPVASTPRSWACENLVVSLDDDLRDLKGFLLILCITS